MALATRLGQKSKDCEFGMNCNERILDHLFQTIENSSLIQRRFSKSWTLQEFLKEAGQIDDIFLQIRDMKVKHDDKDIAKVVDYSQRNIRQRGNQCNNGAYRSRRYQ